MDNGKHKPGRANLKLKELAAELGYTPGEFSLVRFAEDAQSITGWIDDLRVGRVPDDFQMMSLAEARAFVAIEKRALIDRERGWLPFFHPTLKAADVNVGGPDGGPLVVQVVRYGDDSDPA